jgi:hypothetical protein
MHPAPYHPCIAWHGAILTPSRELNAGLLLITRHTSPLLLSIEPLGDVTSELPRR